MKKPITVCATGLGHPEGPYELDDGRVIYANTYASEIGVWDPKTGQSGSFAKVGGGPNACMLGSDGCVYSTQTPNVGSWVAPVHRPPSIQKTRPSGEVEILVTEADGVFEAVTPILHGRPPRRPSIRLASARRNDSFALSDASAMDGVRTLSLRTKPGHDDGGAAKEGLIYS